MPACLEGCAQSPDVHIHRPLFNKYVISPYLIEKLSTTMDALRMRHEEVQKTELCRAEVKHPIIS